MQCSLFIAAVVPAGGIREKLDNLAGKDVDREAGSAGSTSADGEAYAGARDVLKGDGARRDQ